MAKRSATLIIANFHGGAQRGKWVSSLDPRVVAYVAEQKLSMKTLRLPAPSSISLLRLSGPKGQG